MELSGREWGFGDAGGWLGKTVDAAMGEGDLARRAWVVFCPEGEGEREIMPDAILGLPMDLKTVSRVFSILRRERVKISCFLYQKGAENIRGARRITRNYTHLEERFPLLDSSNIHSWLPEMHRLQGGPCSAPTHFIFNRLQTVHALISKN